MADLHEILEGLQELRRKEGVYWQVDTSTWGGTPTISTDITIIRLSDSVDVTDDFTTTATPTVSGDNIVLPKITVPTDAELGFYQIDIPFTGASFRPAIPFIQFRVKK